MNIIKSREKRLTKANTQVQNLQQDERYTYLLYLRARQECIDINASYTNWLDRIQMLKETGASFAEISMAERGAKSIKRALDFEIKKEQRNQKKWSKLHIQLERVQEIIDSLKYITPQLLTEHISRKELSAPTTEVCSICLETHARKNAVMTDCRHCFGAECFLKWIDIKKGCVCPYCKNNVVYIIGYKNTQRAETAAAATT